MGPLRPLAAVLAAPPTADVATLRRLLCALDRARDHFPDPAFQAMCRRAVAKLGRQPELLADALAERVVTWDPTTLRRIHWALRAVVEAGSPIGSGRPADGDREALTAGAELLRELGRGEEADRWDRAASLSDEDGERRAIAMLQGLLEPLSEVLDDAELTALRDRLRDLEPVRRRFSYVPEFRERWVQALTRAGEQQRVLARALSARRETRDAATLPSVREAMRDVVLAGLPLDSRPEPDDVDALLVGGRLLGQLGRYEAAADWFEAVLAAWPGHVEARALRAWTRWLVDLDPKWPAELAALTPTDPDQQALVADLLREMG